MQQPPADLLISITPGIRTLVEAAMAVDASAAELVAASVELVHTEIAPSSRKLHTVTQVTAEARSTSVP